MRLSSRDFSSKGKKVDVLRLKLKKGFPSELAWEELEGDGQNILFSSEDEGSCELYLKHTLFLKEYDFVESIETFALEDTNWDLQWQQHAPGFYDGLMHLDLQPFGCGKTLILKPGPGFGDMSHPTTRLVLAMMPAQIQDRVVIDIGSGSGILSIAASLCGAKEVIGIEIDPLAIDHAVANAALNHVANTVFCLPTQLPAFNEEQSYLIVMNMIVKEQQMAWKMTQFPKNLHGVAIVSGILQEERNHYLDIAKEWGWKLQEEALEEGWLGLRFSF